MRRKDREIIDRAEMEEIISQAQVCRVGFCLDDQPYVVPLNFGYQDGRVFFHCAVEGRKIDMIRKNNRVCFEVELDDEILSAPKPCEFSSKFKSVIGFGRAHIITDPEEKMRGLDVIMAHYDGPTGDYKPEVLAKALVVRIDLEELTGKKKGF